MVQREMSKQMEGKISKIYEGQVEQLKKQMEMMRQQIKSYESENKDLIEKEVNKAREKYDLLLKEKDKQNQLNREAVEKLQESILKLTNEEKSNNKKGREGEKEFCDYADTFKDFQSFQIIDKHTQGGQGDFHLHFEDFDILVDAKNYKKKVPIDQREKIKNDLLKNEHINFAWLVSLNTMIDKWDKSPIMYEWINTSQCIVYINNLSTFEEPQKILRIVWFTCKELYKLIEDGNVDVAELSELKNKQFKLMDKIKEIRKNIRELNTTINNTRNIVQLMDEQLRDIIESESSNIINSCFSLFDEWWDENIEITNDEKIELSTNLWMRFKQDNKTLVKEMEISVDKFKQFIKSKVPLSSLYLKNKNANSAFDIKGILLKSEKIKTSEEAVVEKNIVIELVEDVIKNKKIKKVISKEYYFDEVVDKKIIEHYNENKNDIMILSEIFTLRPWQIVSVLMKHKIIEKREDSRGYDKYKKTEEYKNKIEK